MNKLVKLATVICLLVSVLTLTRSVNASFKKEQLPDDIVRVHIIANSDSPQDQNLKLKIRDEVVGLLEPKMALVNDKAIALNIVKQQQQRIVSAAEAVVRKNGFFYPVEVAVCRDIFPTRIYGGTVYPAGEYDSVKIVIGDGKGKNWWCVLFPPLCFTVVTVDDAANLETASRAPACRSLLKDLWLLFTDYWRKLFNIPFGDFFVEKGICITYA